MVSYGPLNEGGCGERHVEVMRAGATALRGGGGSTAKAGGGGVRGFQRRTEKALHEDLREERPRTRSAKFLVYEAEGQGVARGCSDRGTGEDPTEPQTGRRTFLLSSGGAEGRVLLSGV